MPCALRIVPNLDIQISRFIMLFSVVASDIKKRGYIYLVGVILSLSITHGFPKMPLNCNPNESLRNERPDFKSLFPLV